MPEAVVVDNVSNSMETTEERQKWLDGNQYTRNGILRYERIFGEDFISTGGAETTEEVVSLLSLRPGMKVLDVGCGIGGSVFYVAEHFGAVVDGVDLSSNMLSYAQHKLDTKYTHLKDRVSFKLDDCLTMEIPEGTYDVIMTRDAMLHIADKPTLFSNFYKWLKPGGKLLITDYCHGDRAEHNAEYTEYIKQRNYHLLTVKDYAHILEKIFPEVWSDDRTTTFVKVLNRELAHFEAHKDSFIKDFSEKDYNDILDGWKAKLVRAANNDQAWGMFLATKH
jgi:phosphoethanolamine N-methyltransferase